MLDYGWGPPSMMLSSGDQTPDPPPGQVVHFDPCATQNFSAAFIDHHQETHYTATQQQQPFLHFAGFYDGASAYPDPQPPAGYTMQVPKAEPMLEFNSRIGLNLGGRTYFASSEDDDFVSRLYRRSRMFDPDDVVPLNNNSPRCQAEGCPADLTHAKHYHRRHKVCEFHSKAATVVAAGLAQRFCQQCSRFHLLSEFDNGKRSCRKRLDDHNRRRRKSNQTTNNNNNNNQETSNDKKSQLEPRSPPDSGPHSSSVTVAISSPRVTMDRFGQGSHAPTSSSTASTGYTMY